MTDQAKDWVDKLFSLKPDLRVLAAVGAIALVWHPLDMIEGNPRLLAVNSFVGIAMLLAGNGMMGQVYNFLFEGTQTGSKVMEKQSDAVINSSPPDGGKK